MKYFDAENKRLVYIKNAPNEEFWTNHWLHDGNLKQKIEFGSRNGLVKKTTKKFLGEKSKVIEAGCGIGQNVYGLKQWGYDAYGIDFTKEVIKKSKEHFPNLNLLVQDARKLSFPDNYFDGYWSLGVIEHFTEGYDLIIREARRVLKNGGYLFLTVPWMSPLRKIKAEMNFYPPFKEGTDMINFYEFMLDEKQVVKHIEANGFKLISSNPYDAVKGLKDEISGLGFFLQKVYNSGNIIIKAFRFLVSIIFAPFAGHVILLVFKKIR